MGEPVVDEFLGRAVQLFPGGHCRGQVLLGGERSPHVAGADAQLHHHRGVRFFRQLEAALDHLDDGGKVRPRVEQPHQRLEREGVASLLRHHAALAVVLAEHDQGAAHHAGARQVGERVCGDVGADDRLPGHGAARRVVDRGAEHRRGGSLAGAGLDVHAELVQVVARLHHHVQQVRDRRALVAADIGHARLQQRLGHGEDALAVKGLAVAEPQRLYLFSELPFHGIDFSG